MEFISLNRVKLPDIKTRVLVSERGCLSDCTSSLQHELIRVNRRHRPTLLYFSMNQIQLNKMNSFDRYGEKPKKVSARQFYRKHRKVKPLEEPPTYVMQFFCSLFSIKVRQKTTSTRIELERLGVSYVLGVDAFLLARFRDSI